MTQGTSDSRPAPGAVRWLDADLRCVLAPNPSPMTYWGTNSYILGRGDVVVIDPGPADVGHTGALMAALAPGERISHILVTHAHLDHSAGARDLAAASGAPVHAFGNAEAGRSPVMAALAARGDVGGGEGVDASFDPDVRLRDDSRLETPAGVLRALWTPGHFANHMVFSWEDTGVVFTGDLVMEWASSLVSPPDGDLTAFMSSLDRLSARTGDRVYHAGHGPPVADPAARVADLRAHREMRTRQIRDALAERSDTAAALAARIYTDTPAALLPAAARNVLAHLIDLEQKKEARHDGILTAASVFHPV